MTSTSTAQPRARPGRRGPRTAAGKARAAQNALKHGLRAQKYVVLPEEDPAEFAALETALVEELTPVGALQTMLARRIAVAAWRLAPRAPRRSGRSPLVRARANPSDRPAACNRSCPSRPRPAVACTKEPRPGCRMSPRRATPPGRRPRAERTRGPSR